MNARDKEILAWLENAITAREQAARAAADAVGGPSWDGSDREVTVSAPGNDTIADGVMYGDLYEAMKQEACDHIAANDPESVLQRCAADRALVDVFTPILKNGNKMEKALASYTLRQIALGYGWAKTIPGLKEAVDLAYRSGTRAEYTAACEAYEEARAKAKRPEAER
ncbi:DUF6221 family protein [Streptomyces albidoflavus]